jgi:hypothetical protein
MCCTNIIKSKLKTIILPWFASFEMVCLFGERKKKLPDGIHRKLRICSLYTTSPEIPPKKVHLLGLNLLIIISLL